MKGESSKKYLTLHCYVPLLLSPGIKWIGIEVLQMFRSPEITEKTVNEHSKPGWSDSLESESQDLLLEDTIKISGFVELPSKLVNFRTPLKER